MKIQNAGTPIHNQPSKAELEQKLKDVSVIYEKQFLRDLVKAMRSTVSASELSKPSMGEKIYKEQLDDQYVESWGEQGGIGLQDIIFQQLKEKYLPKEMETAKPPNAKGIELKKSGIDLGVLFKLDKDSEITSPVSGNLIETFAHQDLGHVLRIESTPSKSDISAQNGAEKGPISTLIFKGMLEPLQKGQFIAAGQKLGFSKGLDSELLWNIPQQVSQPAKTSTELGANSQTAPKTV